MKKILALTLTGILAACGTAATVVATASPQAAPQTEISATAQNNLYLVPGTYNADGGRVENVISSGATKLDDGQCDAIFTENAYLCTLSAGDALPLPTSEREGYSFNGWWSIVDATVTYFDKVPEISENTFLYADWRADLSQRRDPVEPGDTTTVKPRHYLSVKHTNGEEETLTLRVSGSDLPSADKLEYGRPVQLYNGWFELSPGDVITVYTAGLGGSEEVQVAPLDVTGRKITLENSGDGSNNTANYLTASTTGDTPTLTYRKTQKKKHFRIYIKFYFGGQTMAIYMEPMD